jgi:protein ImuA
MIKAAEKKEQVLEELRREILSLQGLRMPLQYELQDMGLGAINQAFPNHAFPVAATHEFISNTPQSGAASCGFIAGLLHVLMHKGACLWVSTRGHLFAPALAFFGIAPHQVIFVDVKTDAEAFWLIEEGLKCEALAAVVGEIRDWGFTESRRLQLAVEHSRVTGLIHRYGGITTNVACVSRWQVTPATSAAPVMVPGVGLTTWNVELLKIKNGKPGKWQIQWHPNGFNIITQQHSIRQLAARKAG